MGCECVSVRVARECVSTGAGVMKTSMTRMLPCASSQRKCPIGRQRSQTNTRQLKADGTVRRRSGQQSTRALKEADTWQLCERLMICDLCVREGAHRSTFHSECLTESCFFTLFCKCTATSFLCMWKMCLTISVLVSQLHACLPE